MKLKPCKRCGSTKITLWDCGYSSFNPGGGRCHNGHEVKGESGCSPTRQCLARIWNDGQRLTAEERLRSENRRLKRRVRELSGKLKGGGANRQPFHHDAQFKDLTTVEADAILKAVKKMNGVLEDTVERAGDQILFTATYDVTAEASMIIKGIVGERLVANVECEPGDPADLM